MDTMKSVSNHGQQPSVQRNRQFGTQACVTAVLGLNLIMSSVLFAQQSGQDSAQDSTQEITQTAIQASGQESSEIWQAPRTPEGYPDLQGNWTNPYQTPLQRPLALGGKRTYSLEEAEALINDAFERDAMRQAPIDPNRPAPQLGGDLDNTADGNFEIMPTAVAKVNGEYRTSLIIDPGDGRMPLRADHQDIYSQYRSQGFGNFDGPEIRTALDRCLNPGAQLPLIFILGGSNGNPAGDNPARNIQIVQNKDYIVILSEYFSLVRIIRLGDKHLLEQGRKWMGDSIAHYEGDTLVVHSKHFRPEQSIRPMPSSEMFEVVERYFAVSENELLFRYTITDPNIYSQSFTAEIPLRRMANDQLLYEYACHEGNYSMTSMLRAARLEESGAFDDN
jgi:hypothetical protein